MARMSPDSLEYLAVETVCLGNEHIQLYHRAQVHDVERSAAVDRIHHHFSVDIVLVPQLFYERGDVLLAQVGGDIYVHG